MTARKAKPAPTAREPYSPKPDECAAIAKVLKGRKKAAPAPRLKVEDNQFSIDHPDKLVGHLLMQNALGTLDSAFVNGLLGQLARATSGGSTVNETDLNFMVSFIKEIEPRDQVESALAAQMAAVHMATMQFFQHLPLIASLPQQDAAERAINKFARTYISQMEALKRYRSGGEQKVTVQHVSVSEGGQAIVGHVTQNRETKPDKTPPAPLALAHAKVAPMELVGESLRQATPVKRKASK